MEGDVAHVVDFVFDRPVPTQVSGDPGGAGLVGREAGDDVDHLFRGRHAGGGVAGVAGDPGDLGRAGKRQAGGLGGLDAADADHAVFALDLVEGVGGRAGRGEAGLNRRAQFRPVVLDRQDVVRAAAAQVAGGCVLGVQSIGGHDFPDQGDLVEQHRERGNLVGFRRDFPLGQNSAALWGVRADQRDGRVAVAPRASQHFSVHRDVLEPRPVRRCGLVRGGFGQKPAQGAVQDVGIDAREHAGDGVAARGEVSAAQRVVAGTERGQ